MKRYFITGTDTDCGKTFVTCQLLDWFTNQQQTAQALKPVASGCIEQDGFLINDDITRLQQHNFDHHQAINHKCYMPAISPHLAANTANDKMTVAEIAHFCDGQQFSSFQHLLIEGAGGLMVPLNNEETWLDFLRLTNIPVILVVGMRLGCINHALLTDFALKSHNISCMGWIANSIDRHMPALDENIVTLRGRMHMPLIATIDLGGNLVLEKTVHGLSNPLFQNN